MKKVFESVCIDFESKLMEFDDEKDHVHLLIHYPPKVSISKLVNSLKGVSSRHLRKYFADLGECSLVYKLFFWKLWRSSYRYCEEIYWEPKNSNMKKAPYVLHPN